MDISELKTREVHEEGVELQITHPQTAEKTDLYILIAGPDSKAYRSALRNAQRLLTNSDSNSDDVDNKFLADITLSWRGLKDDGKDVDFSREEAEKLYADAPFVSDQVAAFSRNRKNFMTG